MYIYRPLIIDVVAPVLVAAGVKGVRNRVGAVRRLEVELGLDAGDRTEVGDDKAVEPPLVPQQVVQQKRIRRRRHAVQRVVP
jgi:hypothetical protein